jgi:hypothetical protein
MCRVCTGGRRYPAAILARDSMGSRFGSILDKVFTIKHKTTSQLSHQTIISNLLKILDFKIFRKKPPAIYIFRCIQSKFY